MHGTIARSRAVSLLHQFANDIVISVLLMREQAMGTILDPPLGQGEVAAAIQKIKRAIAKQTVEPVCLVTGIELARPIREILVMLHESSL